MADLIVFNCPYCGQSLDAPQEYAGMDARCPACKKAVVIPAAYHGPGEDAGAAAAFPPELDTAAVQEEAGLKSSTIRIDVGDELILPKAKPRVYKIKRPDHH